MTPCKAIRKKCLDCSCNQYKEVRECIFKDCTLWNYRTGKKSVEVKLTPCKAIREKCLDCCNGQHLEVRKCPIKDCSLWDYRMGKRPKNK